LRSGYILWSRSRLQLIQLGLGGCQRHLCALHLQLQIACVQLNEFLAFADAVPSLHQNVAHFTTRPKGQRDLGTRSDAAHSGDTDCQGAALDTNDFKLFVSASIAVGLTTNCQAADENQH
jgi:hypothetical protein